MKRTSIVADCSKSINSGSAQFFRRSGATTSKAPSNAAGISMAFAEAPSDDGSLTGRGAPLIRGIVCGGMTTLGGLAHTMPYLVPDRWPNAFWIATGISGIVVFCEALGHRLGALSVHGHALPSGGVSSYHRWRAGADRGTPDRRVLISQHHRRVMKLLVAVLGRGTCRLSPDWPSAHLESWPAERRT
jgi:hypothetical protein